MAGPEALLVMGYPVFMQEMLCNREKNCRMSHPTLQ
jgi:hypothetical protein